ncbi:uncharacterized protein LOC130691082 [Daphnia carinata]|uniref:uncharacterized protein LOC130691082 n=1 Tax=Daphnia carinata TaxID=120202 RepID=UPI00257F28F1|nr:uncharacterized protein LOC130691082 [Daphnia carinata]
MNKSCSLIRNTLTLAMKNRWLSELIYASSSGAAKGIKGYRLHSLPYKSLANSRQSPSDSSRICSDHFIIMQYIALVVLALAVVDAGVVYDRQAGDFAYSINNVPYVLPFAPSLLSPIQKDNKDTAVDAKKFETPAIVTPQLYPITYVYGGYPNAFGSVGYPFGVLPLNAKSVTEIKPVVTVVKAAETTGEKSAEKAKAPAVTYVA